MSFDHEVRESADATTTVVFLPALGVPLGYYAKLLDAWSAAGRRVVGVGLRGMPGEFGYRELLREDLPAIFDLPAVRDAERVVLAGHSLGGALALLATGAGIVSPDAVVTVATGSVHAAGMDSALGRIGRRATVGLIRAITDTLGYWPGHRLGFGGRQPRGMMTDWAYEGTHGRFHIHGDPFDYEAGLAAIKVPVLMLGVTGDQWLSPRAVALLAARIPTATRQQVDANPDADHINWARRAPAEVVAAAETWLSAR